MTRLTRVGSAGTHTDGRDDRGWSASYRINNLNQNKRNDVMQPGGPTTTWRYTCDANGNVATKSDGTNQTTYTFDESNRLKQVALPGGATAARMS